MSVAPTATASTRYDDTLFLMCEVCHHLSTLRISDHRAKRYLQDHILAIGTVTAGAFPVGATLGLEVTLIVILEKSRDSTIRFEHDISTSPAVTPVRTTFGHVCLTSERSASAAAVTTAHMYLRLIYEHDSVVTCSLDAPLR